MLSGIVSRKKGTGCSSWTLDLKKCSALGRLNQLLTGEVLHISNPYLTGRWI